LPKSCFVADGKQSAHEEHTPQKSEAEAELEDSVIPQELMKR